MRIARAQISDRSVRYVRVLEQSEILVCAVSPREEKNVPEDIALFIDFENIRYSMLNIQRREPDPQELIAVARRYGTVMVARAYADWSRQPEPFKGSLTGEIARPSNVIVFAWERCIIAAVLQRERWATSRGTAIANGQVGRLVTRDHCRQLPPNIWVGIGPHTRTILIWTQMTRRSALVLRTREGLGTTLIPPTISRVNPRDRIPRMLVLTSKRPHRGP